MRNSLLAGLALFLASPSIANAADAGFCITQNWTPSKSQVLAILHKPNLQKSQFETTDAYAARMTALFAASPTITMAMPLETEVARYDADTEQLTVDQAALHISKVPGVYDARWMGVFLGLDAKILRSYTGENAYGVKRRVTVRKTNEFMIAFVGKAYGIEQAPPPVTVHIPRQDAQKRIAALRVVVAGDPVAPYFISNEDESDPTVSAPIEDTTRTMALTITPKCGAIVDSTNGDVLTTFDPAQIPLY